MRSHRQDTVDDICRSKSITTHAVCRQHARKTLAPERLRHSPATRLARCQKDMHIMGATTCRLTFTCSKHRCGTKPRKKLDVARLKSVDIQRQLENKMGEVIKEQTETTHNVDETWTKLRDTVYQGGRCSMYQAPHNANTAIGSTNTMRNQ